MSVVATDVAPSPSAPGIEEADAWCRDYARGRDENFTVVSWFLPKRLRPHFFALYAFCRWTDDLGDEAAGDRLALLDEWEGQTRRCFTGEPATPLFVALARTVQTCHIPQDVLLRLIDANRIDQRVSRFPAYGDLVDYCSYSATPVGRMVLCVLGYRDEERGRLADATCTGLQMANFWQDVSRDLGQDRIYIPLEDMRRFGVSEADLRDGVADARFRALIEFEAQRARALFAEGRALEPMIDRRARTDVRLFRLGGEAVLAAIARAGYDTLTRRPRVTKGRKLWMALSNGVRMKAGL